MLQKFSSLFIIVLASMPLFGQSVKVKKEVAKISNENIEGYAIELEAMIKDVDPSFTKYLKTLGKVKPNGDYIMLTESTLNGKFYGLPIYGLTKDKGKLTQAWLGIKSNEWSAVDGVEISKQLETMIYNFGIKFYKDKIQEQIDESARALQAVEKQQQRLLNQNNDLNARLEENKRDKIRLEKSLLDNGVEHENLLKRIDKNKKDQDSVALANEQIKKIIELQKEKQRKVI